MTPGEILAGHAPGVRGVAERLRRLVTEVVPEAQERAYPGWHAIGLRHPRAGYFAGIFPYEETVKLAFEWGALLADPEGVLQRGPTGSKRVRYVALSPVGPVPEAPLRLLLLEAVDLRARARARHPRR